MKLLDLSTDVLAIKCIKNYVFIGIACKLYVINKIDCKIKFKINALHPDNIHNIIYKPDDRLIVYGGKSLCIFQLKIINDIISIEKLYGIHRFQDWIINIKWLGSLDDSKITILFAHNNIYNYDLCKKQYSNIVCKETCLLYSGTISGQHFNNIVVFSGTVFQEILIWNVKICENCEKTEILHRLRGHKGVIFSVFYDPMNNLICSTSDDRTVRLWKVCNKSLLNQQIIWENATITLQTTMYGHLARVWKAVLLNNIIASIGEDSRICFWNLSGELLHKIEAHRGAPIWCIDISEDAIIYTGGADGSVNSWPLTSIKNQMKKCIVLNDKKDIIPKYVIFLDNCEILINVSSKNSNKILHFTKNEYQLLNTYDLPEYSSTYCIMELSLNRQCIALASIKGEITLYKKIKDTWKLTETYKIVNSKIFSLQWLNNETVLICASEGMLYVVKFLIKDINILSQFILPSSRERWITSTCIYNNFLICGDRMGSIFVYKLLSNIKDPIQSFKKIHGRLGVQSCTVMNSNLITSGRDGTIRFYEFCNTNNKSVIIKSLYTKNIPMDWISKLFWYENDFYVLGFKEECFLIYSISLKQILVKIPCGGGHRSWDCVIFKDIIHFVYIQKKQVHAVTVPLNTLCIPPLLKGFHTKEIYCVEVLPMLSKHILIFGGEDCTLHINYINSLSSENEFNLKVVNSFDGHLSSIKCLSIFALEVNENLNKYLIFTGGGRAQLKIWEISLKTTEDILLQKDIICKDLLSYMLHGPDKERNKIWIGKELMYNADPETRFMDLSTIQNPESIHNIFIFVACSDGYLRTLNYNISTNEIKLINTLAYKNRCILKVHSFIHQEKILLITMATDGLLNFWKLIQINETIQIQIIEIDKKENFYLHQSGINSYDLKRFNKNEYILATGGDDNLLNLMIFKISSIESKVAIQVISLWKNISFHCAQITGIKLLNNDRFISIGADQKLIIHKYSFYNSKLESTSLIEKNICIPDVQGITFFRNSLTDKEIFCVYGKGLQLLENC